ncbi:MAG: radical SAM protein [Syntrophomonas sp.]
MNERNQSKKHYNIPIFIPHLGCPYDCIYCDQKKIAAQPEVPHPAQVVATIEQYLHTIPEESSVEVAFFGGNFTAVDRKEQLRYLRAVQPFLQQGRVQSIRISTRPDYIDEKILDLLADNGVKMIELGVQSLSDRVLQASARRYRPEDVFKSVHLIKDRQFDLGIQLMIGLPQDSYTQDMETARQVISMRPQVVRIYPTLVIAGTVLETMWRQGDFIPLSLEEAVSICKDMFLIFQKESIRVIRMGLYPGEELRREGVVKAGPFHSSFGELVEQSIFKQQARVAIRRYFDKYGYGTEINLYVHFRDISKMVGKQKSNLNELRKEFKMASLQIRSNQIQARNWVGVSRAGTDDAEYTLTRAEFLGIDKTI